MCRSRSRRRGAPAFALLATVAAVALALCGGCTYLGVATAVALGVAGGGGGGGGGGTGAPEAPSVEIVSSTDRAVLPSATEIPVEFNLVDPTSAAVDVGAEWAPAGGSFRPATPAASSPGLDGLDAAPAGRRHTFVWDAGRDLRDGLDPTGVDKVRTVTFKLTPSRAGLVGRSADRTIQAGNTPPSVEVLTAPGSRAARIVETAVRASDEASDPVVLRLFVTASGIPRREVPIRSPLGAVATAPAGVGSTIFWDSATPQAIGFRNVTTTVEVVAEDRFGAASLAATVDISIENDAIPSVQIVSVGTATGIAAIDGRVPIRFALFDEDALDDPGGPSSAPDVRIQVSLDGGLTFFAPTGILVRHEGRDLGLASLDDLRALPFPGLDARGGNFHTFVWDARADGASNQRQLVTIVRVAPLNPDGSEGQSDTNVFTIGADKPLFSVELNLLATAPRRIAVGDLNGDGLEDIVYAANRSDPPAESSVRVHLATAPGQYGPAAVLPVPGGPLDLALADVTGEGALDVVVATQTMGVALLVNDGAGALTDPRPRLAGEPPLAAGDLDRDGDVDLVVPQAAAGVLHVYRNDGTGGFTALLPELAIAGVRSLALGDVATADGLLALDVVAGVASPSPREVRLLRNAGDGTLAAVQAVPVASDPSALVLGDFDGDGRLDLAVSSTTPGLPAESDTVDVRLGTGAAGGELGAALSFPAKGTLFLDAGDANGDGRLDLLTTQPVFSKRFVRPGRGDGTFGPPIPVQTAGGPAEARFADIDGDGRLDLVAAEDSGFTDFIFLFFGSGRGQFGAEPRFPAGDTPEGAALGDLDLDGRLDLVLANQLSNDLSVRLGQGGAAFGPETRLPSPGGPRDVVLGDLDQDGDLDLVVANSMANPGAGQPDEISVRFWDGAARAFGPETRLPAGDAPIALALGDLDGDARLDIVAANDFTGDISIYRRTPAGGFLAPAFVFVGFSPRDVAVGDVDQDGDLDIVVAVVGAERALVVLRGDGSGAFTPVAPSLPAFNPVSVALGDMDADGRLDIVEVDQFFLDEIRVRQGLGDGRFGPALSVQTGGGGPQELALGDADGDGRLDALVATPFGSFLKAVRARPASRDGAARGGPPARADGRSLDLRIVEDFSLVDSGIAQGTRGIAAGDLNEDGVDDVLLATGNGIEVRIAPVLAVSRPEPAFAGRVAGVAAVRSVPARDLDLALATPAPAVPAGRRLRPVSGAVAYLPEPAAVQPATAVVLPLSSGLTADELAGGVFRVFRLDPELQSTTDPASQIDRRFGRPVYGRPVEVPAADVTVDRTLGRVSFPVTRLGRFQAFLEVPDGEASVFRETFDAEGPESPGRFPLPLGFFSTATWRVGVPDRGGVPGLVPAPASPPNLLAAGLDGDPTTDATAIATTRTFRVPRPASLGRPVTLRLREWHDLGDDRATIRLLVRPTGMPEAAVVVEGMGLTGFTYTGTTSMTPLLAADSFPLTALLDGAIPAAPGEAEVRIELSVQPVTPPMSALPPGRGWFVDDLEVVVGP